MLRPSFRDALTPSLVTGLAPSIALSPCLHSFPFFRALKRVRWHAPPATTLQDRASHGACGHRLTSPNVLINQFMKYRLSIATCIFLPSPSHCPTCPNKQDAVVVFFLRFFAAVVGIWAGWECLESFGVDQVCTVVGYLVRRMSRTNVI